jgi:hypothetical protein
LRRSFIRICNDSLLEIIALVFMMRYARPNARPHWRGARRLRTVNRTRFAASSAVRWLDVITWALCLWPTTTAKPAVPSSITPKHIRSDATRGASCAVRTEAKTGPKQITK